MSPSTARSPIVATIDLAALIHNLNQVRKLLAQQADIIAVVKADAYGHGAVPVARALCQAGAQRLGVATVEEGLALRQAGLNAPILVLGAVLLDQLEESAANKLTPVLHDREFLRQAATWAERRHVRMAVHMKIDTGMGRLGFRLEDLSTVVDDPAWKGPLQLEGVMGHLADADGGNPSFTNLQLKKFQQAVGAIKARGFEAPLVHIANSAAIIRFPASHGTAVRPGIMLYGYHTLPARVSAPDLKPVLSLTVPIIHLHEIKKGESVSYNRTFVAKRRSRIAVLPLGYADGYSRTLSNRGSVLIGGARAPVVGRVCMDMTMVDVTNIPQAGLGMDATVIGRQGKLEITAADIAAWQKTIPYEVLCGLGPRVRRVYREA